MSPSVPHPADDLTLALSRTLRAAFEAYPLLVLDADQLASRLAPGLAATLGEAARSAGATGSGLARALTTRSKAPGRAPGPGVASVEERVMLALTRHASGRDPGVTPDSLVSLTGLATGVLGAAVSALVQSGDLVRDGWLVRLPHADDQVHSRRLDKPEPASNLRQLGDRRSIGDRRALGERRLYERRVAE